MEASQFQTGLKVFLSCGGPNPDEQTIEVWFRMLRGVHPVDFEKAVMDICQNNLDLGRINFVAEVLQWAKIHRAKRHQVETRAERQLPPKDMVPVEDLQKLVKDFNKTLKGMGNDTGETEKD